MVHAALAELSTEYRTILVLREIDGCRYEEIAEILELPVGTVRSRLFRARLALARRACAATARRKNRGHTMNDPSTTRIRRRAAQRVPRRRAVGRGTCARGSRAWPPTRPRGRRSNTCAMCRNPCATCRSKAHLPDDFREAGLRRIECRTKACPTRKLPHGVSIGRTRRGWIWASLAVAAALLIMVVQSGYDDSDALTRCGPNEKPSAGKDEADRKVPLNGRARDEVAASEPEVPERCTSLAAAPAARNQ